MGGIDEPPEIVRRAVESRRREQVDAVVTPTEASVEFGDRHHFDQRDSQFGQLRQLGDRGREGSFGSECADMHLINDLPFPRRAGPLVIVPQVNGRIDNHRQPVRTVRLKSRSRIGIEIRLAIQTKGVERAGRRRRGKAGKVAPRDFRDEGKRRLRFALAAIGTIDNHGLDPFPARRPHSEMHASRRLKFRADRQPPFRWLRAGGVALLARWRNSEA